MSIIITTQWNMKKQNKTNKKNYMDWIGDVVMKTYNHRFIQTFNFEIIMYLSVGSVKGRSLQAV